MVGLLSLNNNRENNFELKNKQYWVNIPVTSDENIACARSFIINKK